MRSTLSKIALGLGLLVARTSARTEEAPKAQTPSFPIKGNFEYIQSEAEGKSFPRGNFFYRLPGEVKGYTFLEAYEDGSAYAKSILSRKLTENVGLSNITRSANEGLTDSGFGMEYNFRSKKGDFKATGKLLPVWLNQYGDRVKNKQIFSFFVSKDLNPNWNVTAYADINLDAKQGAEWVVGEVPITRKLTDRLSVGYIPILRRSKPGSIRPKVEHRAELIWRFN